MKLKSAVVAIAVATTQFQLGFVADALAQSAPVQSARTSDSAAKQVGVLLSDQKALPKAAEEILAALRESDAFQAKGLDARVSTDDVASVAQRLMQENQLDALVFVSTDAKKRKGKVLEVQVFDARDGQQSSNFRLEGASEKALASEVRGSDELKSALSRVQGRAPVLEETPEEAPQPVSQTPAPVVSDAEPSSSGFPYFSAFLGGKAYSRSFVYSGTLNELFGNSYDTLPSYSLPLGPMPHLDIEVLPWAGSNGFLSGLGVVAEGEIEILTSLGYRGKDLAQTHYRFGAGAVYKLPLGSWILAADARYGRHVFMIDGDKTATGEDAFPSVAYSMIEGGLAMEYVGLTTRLGVRASHLQLLSLGDIQSAKWFPNAHGRGLALGAFVSYSISKAWAVRTGIDARILGLDFNPIDPTTPQARVAGGATDQYLGLSLGLEFRLFGEMAASPGQPAVETKSNFDSFE